MIYKIFNLFFFSSKRKASSQDEEDLSKNWRQVLGDPPKRSDGLKEITCFNLFLKSYSIIIWIC